jgi:hypothetical protein
VLRPISDADIEHLHEAARHYADNARRYREQLVPMG